MVCLDYLKEFYIYDFVLLLKVVFSCCLDPPKFCHATPLKLTETRSSAIRRESAHLRWLYCTVEKVPFRL